VVRGDARLPGACQARCVWDVGIEKLGEERSFERSFEGSGSLQVPGGNRGTDRLRSKCRWSADQRCLRRRRIRFITNRFRYDDNLEVMREHVDDASVDLVYFDSSFSSSR
jgi:hypothetical protein